MPVASRAKTQGQIPFPCRKSTRSKSSSKNEGLSARQKRAESRSRTTCDENATGSGRSRSRSSKRHVTTTSPQKIVTVESTSGDWEVSPRKRNLARGATDDSECSPRKMKKENVPVPDPVTRQCMSPRKLKFENGGILKDVQNSPRKETRTNSNNILDNVLDDMLEDGKIFGAENSPIPKRKLVLPVSPRKRISSPHKRALTFSFPNESDQRCSARSLCSPRKVKESCPSTKENADQTWSSPSKAKECCPSTKEDDNEICGARSSPRKARKENCLLNKIDMDEKCSVRSSPRKAKKESRLTEDAEETCGLRSSPRKMKRESSHVDKDDDTDEETSHVRSSPRKTPKKCSSSKSDKLSDSRPSTSRRKSVALGLQRQQGECYQKAKQALHTSVPDRLLCREKETKAITSFLQEHLDKDKPGSMYISGAPGTGKTACLSSIMNEYKDLIKNTQTIFINCMSVKQSQQIYNKVLCELCKGRDIGKVKSKDVVAKLEKEITKKGPKVLLILDEIDHLDSKNQEVLYTMFEWPALKRSRLVLIGIANALDLTDRILPRLQARPRCKPQLLHFAPYTKDQISTILKDRLSEATENDAPIVEPMAVQFCARKVAAVAGDIRKALDVCRRAVELVENDVRRQTVLKTIGSPRKSQSSPRKSVLTSPRKSSPRKTLSSPSKTKSPAVKKVGLVQISSVISEVYSSSLTACGSDAQTFPIQQKLVICTVLLMVKKGKLKEVTLGKLHEMYSKICRGRQMVPVDQSECLSLCELVETRGILRLKRTKEIRQTKICLKLDEKELEFALQDKILVSSILKDGLPSTKKK